MKLPQSVTETSIDRGTILHSTDFEGIGHGKFFVIIGVSGNNVAGFFFINSNIHPVLFGKKEQLAMQYPMKKSDYDFLKYDSFLCATAVMTRDRTDMARLINEGVMEIKGIMKQEHLEELLDSLRKSKLFSAIEKRDFFY